MRAVELGRDGKARVLAALALGVALAASFDASARACDEAGAERIAIASVTADLDIVLQDHRTIRLAGIRPILEAGAQHMPDSRLSGWIMEAAAGDTVGLKLLAPIADRWGRLAGDIFIGGRHLQSVLAEEGLGLARPDDLRTPCWLQIRAAEAQARKDSAGQWADTKAFIVDATDAAKLSAREGLFTLALGRVRHIGRRPNRAYVDLGPRGSKALFVTIDQRALTRMDKLGFKVEGLTGRRLLVRGVIAGGRAPHMAIDDLDALEFWD